MREKKTSRIATKIFKFLFETLNVDSEVAIHTTTLGI